VEEDREVRCVSIFAAAIALCCAAEQPRLQADRIVITKSAHTMKLLRGNQVIREYKVALGGQPVGPKKQQGDHKTPEGDYKIDWKQEQSRFHLALHVSYPNSTDRARARERGVNPGGSIMIHGLEKKYSYWGALHRQFDWTDGCIAVTNAEIEEIWKLVPVGTRVEIRP
jgi:murein L,D-transpeptidase YafK